MRAEIRAFREILAQQTVGVLVAAPLPWALRVAEVDLDAGIDLEAGVLRHLGALVPGERASQFLGQGGDGTRDRVTNRLGAVSCKRRPVLDARPSTMTLHARQMQQHREARRALDQRADRRAAEPQDQVAFPVARHRPVIGFGRTLGDHDVGRDEVLASQADTRSRRAQGSSCSQASGQLAAQGTAGLDEERLVDGFVADAHPLVIREVHDQASGDLFRAPRPRPSPILSRPVPATLPRHGGPRDRIAFTGPHHAGELLFHIGAQRRVPGKLRTLGPAGRPLGMPLGDGRAIVQGTATRGRIASDLTRYRRGAATEPTSDLLQAMTLDEQQRDLLAFHQRQISAR